MSEIRDCYGHLICLADKSSGYVEAVYKKQIISTYLTVGKAIRIERLGSVTIVTRDTETTISVERYATAT